MKITVEHVINFVINHGTDYGVAMKDVEFVGIDRVLSGANAMGNLEDYFCLYFGTEYDMVYSGWLD